MPTHLLRVWSDQSNGTNTPTLFAPASFACGKDTEHELVDRPLTGNISSQLRTAFLGRDAPDNPFIFFTNTLLFALQLAAYMKSNKHTNIYISCIGVATAETTGGKPVAFHIASTMLKEYGVELRNRSDDSVREYEGVFVATTSVHVGRGSLYLPYETLVAKGLFELYPELEEVTKRPSVRLQLTVSDLRKYWFTHERALTDVKVGVAARLAAAFWPILEGELDGTVPVHLFASLLALQKRDMSDPALTKCIDRRSAKTLTDLTENAGGAFKNTGLPEVDQYEMLMNFIAGRKIHRLYLTAISGITSASMAKEVADWTAWYWQSRNDYRATRTKREVGDPRRLTRQGQGRNGYRERREERGANRLHSKPRLSREDYRASRPDRRSAPGRPRPSDGRSRSPVRHRRR